MTDISYAGFLQWGWPINALDREIVERWRAAGRGGYPSTESLNHMRWRVMFESDRFPTVTAATAEWFTPPPSAPSPMPPPSPLPPLTGIARPLVTHLGSDFLHDAETGAVHDYREATAMSIYRPFLDGKIDEVEALFDHFARNGVNAIRPLFNLQSDYWTGRGLGNSHLEGDRFWGELHPFCHLAARYGLNVRCCLLGGVEAFVGHQLDWSRRGDVISDNPDARDRIMAYVDQFVGTVRSFPERNVLIELANEPSQIGLGWESQFLIEDVLPHVVELAPTIVTNIGAANDEDNTDYCVEPATLFDEHLRRMPEADYLMSIKRLIGHTSVDYARGKMPMISGEWMNLGDVRKDDGGRADGTPSTATAFATAVMCRLKRIIPSFHNHGLLFGRVPNELTQAALRAWRLGLDLVPVDVVGTHCNGHWPESPFHDRRETIFPPSEDENSTHQGPVRIYGLSRPDGGFVGLSIREPAGYVLDADRPIETLHLERWGDWQCRLLQTT